MSNNPITLVLATAFIVATLSPMMRRYWGTSALNAVRHSSIEVVVRGEREELMDARWSREGVKASPMERSWLLLLVPRFLMMKQASATSRSF